MRAEQAAAFLGRTCESRKSSASCSGEAWAGPVMAAVIETVNAKASEFLCTGLRGLGWVGFRRRGCFSQRSAVEMGDGDGRKIDAFQAANIDRSHLVSFGILAFGVGVDAACRAEAMLQEMLVEQVDARIFFRRGELERTPGNEPEERSLALAYRTVARQAVLDLALDLEGDGAAVAASLVSHGDAPRLLWAGIYATGRPGGE